MSIFPSSHITRTKKKPHARMSATLDLHLQSKRNKPIPSPNALLKPAPMSKMTQSAELDDYTASMRQYLANVENAARMSRKDSESSESSSRGCRTDSVSGSDREKSPEFRWMDLASVRKEHGSTVSSHGGGHENRISKSTPKSISHLHHGVKDPRQYHREYRPSSPGKPVLSKRHPVQVVSKSAEKN